MATRRERLHSSDDTHRSAMPMPTIPYTAKNFGARFGSHLSGHHSITLSWNELVWAAMTMGKPGVAFLLSHGWHSVSDLLVRSHTLYANLRESGGGIEKSSLYVGLDPSEKSGVSYFMGMVAAKVLGARFLDTPWLFHLSMLKALGGAGTLIGSSQPDLIGLTRRLNWIVVEAKGRTWKHSASAMTVAKLQTKQLRKINGAFPSLRVAVQASFNPRLEWALEDPEEIDEDAIDLSFALGEVLEMYYSAAVSATTDGETRQIGGRKYSVRELPEVGVTVGFDREVRDRLMAPGPGVYGAWLRPERGPSFVNGFEVFADGLAVCLDDRWSEARMARDPMMRRTT